MDDDLLPGRFEDPELLDRGSMGEVYVARERDLLRKVAVKVLSSDFEDAAGREARFLREIRITAQLDHPNIVPIYSFEGGAAAPSFSMKLIEGVTFATYIQQAADAYARGEEPGEAHALPVRIDHFLKVCDAVHYAHDNGVIHRDLKPANLMLGSHHEVYVMDWGVAKALRGAVVRGADEPGAAARPGDVEPGSAPDATVVGAAVGTPQYMSPEQANGATDLDAGSDQYALGLILFELVTLRPGVPAPTAMVALGNAMMGELAPLKHVAGRPIPPELKAIILKATAVERSARYPSVAALAEDLRRFRNGEAVHAQPDTALQAAARWVGKHRNTALVALLGLLLLFFGSTTFSLWRAAQVASATAAREEALGALLTSASGRAQAIDARFLLYEGLLESLVAAGVHALDGPPRPDAARGVLLPSHFEDPARAPADYAPAPAYGGKALSVLQPVFVPAPGGDSASLAELAARMAPVGERMRRLMVQSRERDAEFNDPAAVRRSIADEGVPIVWTYIGLEEGVHMAFPGKTGYPDGYDPRARPWYRLGARTHGPRWGNAYLDALGQGLLLPCTMALYDRSGAFRGVAGLELTFRFIADELLELPGYEDRVEALLVDQEGRVVVRSGEGPAASTGVDGALKLPVYPNGEVIEAVREQRSGWTQVGAELVAFHRMDSTGWYYVVAGPSSALLGE